MFLGSGDALPEIKRLAVELGLQDNVEFAGWAGDECVGEALATADVGLAFDPRSPLNDASTMIKVAEYESMALPLVAFDLPESVVTAEGAALFAAGNDEAEFADRVDDLLNDPELRARLGTAGQARIAGPSRMVGIRGAVARSVSTDPRQLTPLRRTSQVGLRAAFGRSVRSALVPTRPTFAWLANRAVPSEAPRCYSWGHESLGYRRRWFRRPTRRPGARLTGPRRSDTVPPGGCGGAARGNGGGDCNLNHDP